MGKSQIFKTELIKVSTYDTFKEALVEFEAVGREKMPGQCLCTQELEWCCYMLNKTTGEKIIVGRCCINKFGSDDHRAQLKALERKTYDCLNCNKKRIRKVAAKVKMMCQETDLVFAWEKIPDLKNSGDADELRARVLNGSATTEEVLCLDKFWFRKLFKKDSKDEDLSLVWRYSPHFPVTFTTLYKNPNHIIRRIMSEQSMDDLSDTFPEMPKTNIPIYEINTHFKFHNPVSVYSSSTVPRMVNAFWCKQVLVSEKRDQSSETAKTKYETNSNYLICMGICKDFLKIANPQSEEDVCGEDEPFLGDLDLDTTMYDDNDI